jgi:predicted porin
LLSRYTYIADKDNLDRDVDYSNEESHIIEVEGIYSLNAKVDVGAKYAHKDKTEDFERASGNVETVESNINLYGVSASYHIIKEWDVTGEYHWKTDTQNDELEQGALISVNKHLSDNFKVGVGYNFSGFDGNLANDDDYDAQGVFINLVGKI